MTPRSTRHLTSNGNGAASPYPSAFTPMSTRAGAATTRSVKRSFLAASSVIFLFLFLMYGMKSMEMQEVRTAQCVTAASRLKAGGSKGSDPTFQCPDGRRGLHVVQTRFMLGQSDASISYIGSRLVLMNTFFVGTLNAQSSQAFVVMVHYEEGMNASVVQAMREVAGRLTQPVMYHKNVDGDFTAGNSHSVAYSNVTRQMVAAGLLPKDHPPFDIYISSRLDMDDAVNSKAVAAYHAYACGVPVEEARGNCSARLRLIYPITKLLWFPSIRTYGSLGAWRHKWKLDRWLPTLSSMVIVGADNVVTSPLDIYSFNHAMPFKIGKLSTPEWCFAFNRTRHLVEWTPGGSQTAGLYVRTAGTSTAGSDKGGDEQWPANLTTVTQFGVVPGELVATNALFYGLQANAADALKATISSQITG